MINGVRIALTAAEITALDTKDAAHQAGLPAKVLSGTRAQKYQEADAEFVRRSLIAAEANTAGLGKVRGGHPKDRLTAISIKSTGALRAALAAVHDKLDTLKDTIEVVADQAALDDIHVTDNIHWI